MITPYKLRNSNTNTMSIQYPVYIEAELARHWDAKYLRSEAAVQIWKASLAPSVQKNSALHPWEVATWDELKTHQREVSLRLMQKAALLPDATSRLSGRALVTLVVQLQAALGNTQEACFNILLEVLEEFNLKPSISTFSSFRVAKCRYMPR